MKYSHIATLKEGLNIYKLAKSDDGDDVEIRNSLEKVYREETKKNIKTLIKMVGNVDIIYVMRNYNTNIGFILGDTVNGYVREMYIFEKYRGKKYDEMFLTYISEFTRLKKKDVRAKELSKMRSYVSKGYIPKGIDKDGNVKLQKKDKFKRKK